MSAYREHRLTNPDGLSLYAREFGPSTGLPLFCLHGLTRNAADFDLLAAALGDAQRLIAIDFRGRARSDRDPQWQRYKPATYVDDVLFQLDALEIPQAVFFGTSLGGLVTMMTAAQAPERIRAAALNDIGPVIEPAGLARIQAYTGQLPPLTSWDDAIEQMRVVYGDGLTDLDDDGWRALAHRSCAEDANGVPYLDFDPNIGRAIREIDMGLGDPWALFDHLRDIPTLVLRGENSDILGRDTVATMQARKPDLIAVEIPNRAHVPLLNEPTSVAAIREFLEANQ
ncbi:MAG: alpha/beta hydrolase [Pseudomonadota bacterium]